MEYVEARKYTEVHWLIKVIEDKKLKKTIRKGNKNEEENTIRFRHPGFGFGTYRLQRWKREECSGRQQAGGRQRKRGT